MITKIIKILKMTILCGVIVLAVILVNKYCVPEVNAAHNSAEPESFIFTVTEISLDTSDTPEGGKVNAWEGSEEIDIAAGDPLSDIATLSAKILPGKYYRFSLYAEGIIPQVMASVVVDGTTYYTKTSHTNYTTGPAELEEIDVWAGAGASLEQRFSPPIELTGAEEIHVLFDLSYLLLYFDGDLGTSSLGDSTPFWSQAAGIYLPTPKYAFTFGAPGSKEEYEYTVSGHEDEGPNSLTLIFDADDNLIGLNCQPLLTNNNPGNYLWGFVEGQITDEVFQDNGDGTYEIQLTQQYEGTMTVVFEDFKRANHTGNFTVTSTVPAEDSTGTYACVKTN